MVEDDGWWEQETIFAFTQDQREKRFGGKEGNSQFNVCDFHVTEMSFYAILANHEKLLLSLMKVIVEWLSEWTFVFLIIRWTEINFLSQVTSDYWLNFPEHDFWSSYKSFRSNEKIVKDEDDWILNVDY